jgi:hypothetical protein
MGGEMNPTEIIRSQPFKYAAHMTEADEAWVAAHMFRAVTQEQRDNENTPGRMPYSAMNETREVKHVPIEDRQKAATQACKDKARKRHLAICDQIRHLGEFTAARAAREMGLERQQLKELFGRMVKGGLLEIADDKARNRTYRVV